MAHDGHLVHAGLAAARFHFCGPLDLLVDRQFEALQILKRGREFVLTLRALAFDFLERGSQVFATAVDGAQEGRERQAANVGIVGPLLFAGHTFFQIGELALQIVLHTVERSHSALQIIDAEALQAHQ